MDEQEYSRPTSVEDLLDRTTQFTTAAGRDYADRFRPRHDDVFIVTPSKCGTTWMEQIVHGLRTHGSMDFTNINDVVPWIDQAYDVGQDLTADQVATPRAFKTHRPLGRVPSGARSIVVVRDPVDAMLSLYRFLADSFFSAAHIDVETFAAQYYLPRFEVGEHVLDWWPRRRDADVLGFCYEDLRSDLAGVVSRVADFLGLAVDDTDAEVVVRQAGFSFMKQHEEKFDDAALFETFRHRMRLPPTSRLSKVAAGGGPEARTPLSETIQPAFERTWEERVAPATGLASYAELRRALAIGS